MPTTPQAITVDPRDTSVDIHIRDTAGSDATAYTTKNGSSAYSWPATISTPTTFWFTTGVNGQNPSATPYYVSAKFNGIEVASPTQQPAFMLAQTWAPGFLSIALGLELAALLLAGGSGGSDVGWGTKVPVTPWGEPGFVDPANDDFSAGWFTADYDGEAEFVVGFGDDGVHIVELVATDSTSTMQANAANNSRVRAVADDANAQFQVACADAQAQNPLVVVGVGATQEVHVTPALDLVFTHNTNGVILADRSNGHTYRLKIDGGTLGVEQVT